MRLASGEDLHHIPHGTLLEEPGMSRQRDHTPPTWAYQARRTTSKNLSQETSSRNWLYRRVHGRAVSRSYCWFAPMECRSAPSKAGSFAVSSRLRWTLVAVNDRCSGARAAHVLADLVGGVGSRVRETAVQTSSID